jgi:hypothetical protein
MKRIIALMAGLALATVMATAAQAQQVNIHDNTLFVTSETSSGFTVGAKVTGLGGGDCFAAFVTGAITGHVQCSNPGQPHPPKPKRFSEPVSAGAFGTAPGNGQITTLDVTLTIPTPSASICTNGNTSGWTVTLLDYSGTVSYEVCDLGPNPGTCPTPSSCAGAADNLEDSAGPISVSFP